MISRVLVGGRPRRPIRRRSRHTLALTTLGATGLVLTLVVSSGDGPGAGALSAAKVRRVVHPATTVNTADDDNDCGGVGPTGLSGSWTCTFDDEFDGTSLDTTKWVPQVTATSGYTSGRTACFVNSPNNISVANGDLQLTALETAQPFTCTDPAGSFPTQETSGMVSTYGLFNQTYGAFEVRAQLPPSIIKGLQETFWLYPQNETEYGRWPDSGEIDFGEFYSLYPTLDIPYIHYNEAAKDPNVTAYDCIIVPGTFNTYTVDWTPGNITVLYNGIPCVNDTYNPAAPLTSPQPFDQPFFISLTQALGVAPNAYTAGLTQLPATTTIDYVRAWEPSS
jgi:beta-glucanase (GH16 family)